MAKKKKNAVDVDFEDVVKEIPVDIAELSETDEDVIVGVVLTKCRVIAYNKASNVLVYERDGQLIQTNALAYDGSGYVEVE